MSPTIDPPRDSEPQRETALDDAMDRLMSNSSSSTKENISPFDNTQEDVRRNVGMKVSPSTAMPSRNSPLSWQRRPNSQASDRSRSRPLSMVATENAARSPRATPEPASATEPTFSREQIAQNLAGKDPAWFRQTADRGLNSPAYRKNQVEDEDRSEHGSSSTRIQMPGMSREASREHKATEESTDRSISPSSSMADGSSSRDSYQPGTKAISSFGSPMPLTAAQKLEPPLDARSESRSLAMSPSQGRISPERLDRPPSPTKGMGGFVQSAMMKRSDSVSKRWSVQSPPGLTRGNSVTSNRSSVDTNSSIAPGGTTTRPVSLSRENSPRPSSRPTSSHSNATVTQDRPGTSSSMRSSTTTSTLDDGFVKPSLPASKTQTPIGIKIGQGESSVQTPTQGETTPPSSPSKTMDPRRWSPTKSSWLESALNKPESPKPKSVAPPQQPAWMSEINKAKQKASVDLSRTTPPGPKHEVSIGGLMRSPPPGGLAKPSSIGGLPTGFSSGSVSKSRPEGVASQASSESLNLLKSPESSASNVISPTSSAALAKVKPETPPKKDFRASLKSRQPPPDTSGPKEPEFKNVFGQLRRTKTQNFVAPDELKDNITRGKAALNLTGGPKKIERKDEFKEAILKKKDDFKKAQLEGKGVARSTSGGSQETPLPEALAKRQALGRSGSIVAESESAASDSPSRSSTISDSPKPSFVNETSTPGRLQAKEPALGKLAGRLNPGLAGLLARGPPPVSDDSARSANLAFSRSMAGSRTSTMDHLEAGPQLTHITKSRARGPRRKAPSNAPVNATVSSDPEVLPDDKPSPTADLKSPPQQAPPQDIRTNFPVRAAVQEFPLKVSTEASISQPSSPRKLDMKRRSQFLRESPTKMVVAESHLDSPKSLSPTKKSSPTEIFVKPEESPSVLDSPLATRTKPDTPAKLTSLSSKITSPVTSPTESTATAHLRPSRLSPTEPATYNQESNVSSPKPAPLETAELRPSPLSTSKILRTNENLETPLSQGKKTVDLEDGKITNQSSGSVSVKNAAALFSSSTNSVQSPRARSPIKLPTHEDEKMAMVGAGLRPPSPAKERGLQSAPAPRPLPTPPAKSIVSPPLSAGLTPSSDPSKTISDFFSDWAPSKDFMVDTATLLASRPDQGENIKTLRASLCQISLEGKKQPVPAHQERILFEENLYLCNHTFGNSAGKRVTEVYFWYGDFVPKNIVDQVEVFAQREARSTGGKLVTIKQGKETPEFFHALGGIIITRRGSSNKYDSLAPHILCCRKHLGQIVFDEVDFAPTSLCSGFPYLISTQSGKSYLWKGKGTGIEELGCARLIGMDFGLTGEVEEVEDGSEPASFLNIFGAGATIPKSADHWRMKPNYNHYLHRLFLADSKTKEQVSHD